ncbi:hypothetical protein L6255_02890 [Candidatus Parcubacteria bacterium]|nr:hypothetical protein [Candidatus Parcubacteria bacterium]
MKHLETRVSAMVVTVGVEPHDINHEDAQQLADMMACGWEVKTATVVNEYYIVYTLTRPRNN